MTRRVRRTYDYSAAFKVTGLRSPAMGGETAIKFSGCGKKHRGQEATHDYVNDVVVPAID
jgi:hypothetical protein